MEGRGKLGTQGLYKTTRMREHAMNKSRTNRVSFGIDAELAKQMQAAGSGEAVPTNLSDFSRKLLPWTLSHYRVASSLRILRQAVVTVPELTLPESRSVRRRVRKAKKQVSRVSGAS
jgi:hypothetical protein